jgi:predicted Zn-ribbon and HTH transcriptional regulator
MKIKIAPRHCDYCGYWNPKEDDYKHPEATCAKCGESLYKLVEL